MDRAKSDDRRVERRDFSADQGLSRHHKLSRRHNRVYVDMRHGSMSAATKYSDVHLVGAGKERTRLHNYITYRCETPEVETDNRADVRTSHDPLLYHASRAPNELFCRLEHKLDASPQPILVPGEDLRRGEGDGGVAVMATSMHLPWIA